MSLLTLVVSPWKIKGTTNFPSYEVCTWEPVHTAAGRISDHGNGHVYWMTMDPVGGRISNGDAPNRESALEAANHSLQEYCTSMR